MQMFFKILKSNNCKHLFICFIFLFFLQKNFSQNFIYKHFGVDEGLPSAEVYDIYQDKQGNIWFATDKGLSRFNGYEFKNYTTKEGLPDNTILDFYPQENGQIWAYGYQSQRIFYFDDLFDGFKEYKYNDILKKELRTGSIIKSIVFDKNETLYVGGSRLCGLIEISKEGKLTKRFDLNENFDKASEDRVYNFGVNTKNGSFFTVCYNKYKSSEDFLFFSPKYKIGSRIDFIFLNKDYSVFIDQKLGVLSKTGKITYYETEQNPIGIKRINKDLFFVGYYNNGAEIRDVSGKIIEKFLPNKFVTNFFIDKEGSYWLSTLYDGVFYIKNPKIKVFTEESVSSLVKDDRDNLYAGFSNGNIARFSKNKIDFLYKGLKTNVAFVEFNKENNTLFGYSDGYLKDYTNNKKNHFLSANKLPEYIDSSTLTSSSSGFYKLQNDSTSFTRLKHKTQDISKYKDTILIGTSSGLFIKKNGIVKKHQPKEILKLRIDDIDVNRKTNIAYMATQGDGVVVYSDSIYNITKKDGLTNDIVGEIHIENDSTIWACTNTGLNRIIFKSNKSFKVKTVTKSDGLLSNDIDDIEIINDTIWVATKKGLCFIKKDFFNEKETSNILSLTLKYVLVNNNSVNKKNVNLKYNQNNIYFKIQAISHKNTNKINYLYRLKEIDTSWTKTKNRTISFPSLSPGEYTFEVKANILNNSNNNLITYSFTILPPFWRSWWFRTLCILILSGLFYVFFKIRVLTYNKDVIREFMRLLIKKLKKNEKCLEVRINGEDIKILTNEIFFVKSSGNYLDIITATKIYTIRCKIGDFIKLTPDTLEFLRVHRSYIIRIDKVSSKSKKTVTLKKEHIIPVGETYISELNKIHF